MKTVTTYAHHEPIEQEPDPRPGSYYVSIIRDGGDYRLLLGPFERHADALAAVDPARATAERVDPRACWYAYGTARLEPGNRPIGIINDLLPDVPGLVAGSFG